MQDINQNIQNNLANFHMAGIIPVSGSDIEANPVPWHKCLTQIGENLLAVERSVLECNFAGCESIWIICNEEIQPLIKHRIGDYVVCFESLARSKYVPYPQTKIEQIPIFYVPIPAYSRTKRDNIAWSILHGANEAFMVSAKISKWLVPNKYFVSFPYGVYDPRIAAEGKKLYFSEQNVFISHQNRTVAHNLYTGFTFRPNDFKIIRRKVKEECTGMSLTRPVEDRWSSRYYSLDKFYNCDNIENIQFIEIDRYQSCDDWPSYKKYLQSEMFDSISKYNLQKLNGFLRKKKEDN